MSYTYTTYSAALQEMIASQGGDVDFMAILPSCIDYAEQRIYRTLNLLDTVQIDSSVTTVTGQRGYTLPNTFVVVNQISIITPAGATSATGTRVPLVPISLEALNFIWPGNVVTAQPSMFAMQDQWNIVLGASPDNNYTLEVTGTFRPAPLSSTTPMTYLSTYLPDLFLAASMIFMSGYMRNFGTQSTDPQMGASWEDQYGKLLASAALEEERKRFWSSSWSPHPPSASAQPQRG